MLEPVLARNDKKAGLFIITVSVLIFLAIAALGRIELKTGFDFDVHIFAKINAVINSAVSLLLIFGLAAVKYKNYRLHKKDHVRRHHIVGPFPHFVYLSPPVCRRYEVWRHGCHSIYLFHHPSASYFSGSHHPSIYFVHRLSRTHRRMDKTQKTCTHNLAGVAVCIYKRRDRLSDDQSVLQLKAELLCRIPEDLLKILHLVVLYFDLFLFK